MKKLLWLLFFPFFTGLYAYQTKENLKVNLAFLTKEPNSGKICLQANTGSILSEKEIGIQVGGDIQISRVEKTKVSCEDHDIKPLLNKPLIILPETYNGNCHTGRRCKAALVFNNSLLVKDGNKCFDVVTAKFWLGQEQSPTSRAFMLTDMQPYKLTCSTMWLKNLLQNENVDFALHDIWSPVEDIANQAIAKVENFGERLVEQITQQINSIQDSIVNESNAISDTMKKTTDEVIDTLQNNTNMVVDTVKVNTNDVIVSVRKDYVQLAKDVTTLDNFVKADEGAFVHYVHIIIRVWELFCFLVFLVILYKVYRMANGIYGFFKWIGGRLHRHPHRQVAHQ